MSKLTVKERINALQRTEQRPSTSLGLVDAQRRISNGSKNVKERAHYFQQAQSPAHSPNHYEFDTISSTSNSTSNHSNHSTHSTQSTSDNTTPPSTIPPSSPRLLHVQTPSSSIRVENGSVTSDSHADSTFTTLTPTPSSPAFTATTDVNFQVPELVETDLQHNQEIVQLLRNDKQLSFEEDDGESERDNLSDVHDAIASSSNHLSPVVSHSPPTQVIEATQDLANLSTSFSATPPAPTRSIYDDIDEDSGGEGGWATVIT